MPTNEIQSLDLNVPAFVNKPAPQIPSIREDVESELSGAADPSVAITRQAFVEQKKRLGAYSIDWATDASERLGEPVDKKSGIPLSEFWNYIQLPDNRRNEWLIGKYGAGNIVKDAEGEILVRRFDQDRKEYTWGRLAGESDSILYNASRLRGGEVIGGALGALVTGGPRGPIANIAVKSIGAAVGSAVGETLSQNIAEDIAFGDNNPVANAAANAKKIPLNAALDFGFGIGGYTLGKVFSPLAHSKTQGGRQLSVDLDKATLEVNKLMEDSGMDIRWKSTIGERTQNPELLGIESFWSKQPGSQPVFDKFAEEQAGVIKALQKISLGQNPRTPAISIPNVEQTGLDSILAIGSSVQPMKDAVRQARRNASSALASDVESSVISATGKSSPIPSLDTAGKLLRDSAFAMRARFKALSGYEQFKTDFPAFSESAHSASGLSAKFKDIQSKLPSIMKEVEEKSPILDEFGNQIINTVEQKQLLSTWSPDGVLGRLKDIAGNPSAKVSLDTLKQMRTDLDGDILAGQALPDSGTRYLRQIRAALTDEMDAVVSGWKDPKASLRWGMINDNYRRNASAYDSKIIRDIFTEPTKGGRFVSDGEIANAAISDPQAYKDIVGFFGAASDQVATLRRSVADKVLQSSQSGLAQDVIDAGKLSSELRRLFGPDGNKQLAEDVFGKRGIELANLAEGVKAIQQGSGKSAKDLRIGIEDLESLLSSSTRPTATAIKDAVKKQADLDSMFVNEFRKRVASGDVSGIRPQEIVDKILRSPEFSNTDIAEIMKVIRKDPSLAGKVKTLAMMDIFNKASFAAKASDNPNAIRRGLFDIDVVGLRKEIGLAGEKASGDIGYQVDRIKEIVGEDSYQNLVQMTQLLSPNQAKKEIASVGGSMAAGTQRGKITSGNVEERMQYAYDKVHGWILATAYNNPAIAKAISNQVMTPERRLILAQGLIASSATVQNTLSVWGPEWTEWFLETAKDRIDDGVKYIESKTKRATERTAESEIRSISERWISAPTNLPKQSYELMVPKFAQ